MVLGVILSVVERSHALMQFRWGSFDCTLYFQGFAQDDDKSYRCYLTKSILSRDFLAFILISSSTSITCFSCSSDSKIFSRVFFFI